MVDVIGVSVGVGCQLQLEEESEGTALLYITILSHQYSSSCLPHVRFFTKQASARPTSAPSSAPKEDTGAGVVRLTHACQPHVPIDYLHDVTLGVAVTFLRITKNNYSPPDGHKRGRSGPPRCVIGFVLKQKLQPYCEAVFSLK